MNLPLIRESRHSHNEPKGAVATRLAQLERMPPGTPPGSPAPSAAPSDERAHVLGHPGAKTTLMVLRDARLSLERSAGLHRAAFAAQRQLRLDCAPRIDSAIAFWSHRFLAVDCIQEPLLRAALLQQLHLHRVRIPYLHQFVFQNLWTYLATYLAPHWAAGPTQRKGRKETLLKLCEVFPAALSERDINWYYSRKTSRDRIEFELWDRRERLPVPPPFLCDAHCSFVGDMLDAPIDCNEACELICSHIADAPHCVTRTRCNLLECRCCRDAVVEDILYLSQELRYASNAAFGLKEAREAIPTTWAKVVARESRTDFKAVAEDIKKGVHANVAVYGTLVYFKH
ncbi:hypothetical protein BC830DRAFT_297729 [Chytriomyces sp. MP71]|nr:hypothetical protein BC830DRAFT_297729 [Chytriomyces sp. MP71]